MKRMRYPALVGFILLVLLIFGSFAEPSRSFDAQNGLLDLRDWSSEKDGNIWIDGEWEFYWEKLLTQKELKNTEPDLYVSAPRSWNYYKIDGKNLLGEGYATYRLRVVSNLPKDELVALKVKSISSAYRLYVDDSLIMECGTVGTTKEEEKAAYDPKTVTFRNPGNEFDLILQVSNHQFSQGGMWYGILFGEAKELQYLNNVSIGSELFILGAVFILAMFNLIIFFLRRDLKYALCVFIFSFFLGICSDTFGQLIMLELYPFSAATIIFLWNTSAIWVLFFFLLFLHELYRSRFSAYAVKICLVFGVALQLFYTFTDTAFSSRFIYLTMLAVMMEVIASLAVAVIGIRNGKREAWLHVASIIVATIAFVHDIIYWSGFAGTYRGEMIFNGILVFLILQMLVEAKRIKQSVEERNAAELIFLQAQIKPHFLYNTLNTIVSVSRYDTDGARELLLNLSSYLRRSFDFKDLSQTVPLKHELELAKAYVNIEKARFQERLEINFEVSDELETRVSILVLQPIIENAVNHGVLPKREGGRIDVSLKRDGKYLVFSVKDNGVGIEPQEKKTSSEPQFGSGVGLSNVNNRLVRLYGKGLQINSQPGMGTEVIWKIPIDRKER